MKVSKNAYGETQIVHQITNIWEYIFLAICVVIVNWAMRNNSLFEVYGIAAVIGMFFAMLTERRCDGVVVKLYGFEANPFASIFLNVLGLWIYFTLAVGVYYFVIIMMKITA